MTSGIETFRSIEATLARAKSQAEELGGNLQVASAELVAVERTITEQYRALAGVRVVALAQGKVLGALDEAEHRVQGLMKRREGELQQLGEKRSDALHRREQLESRRSEQNEALTGLGEELDSLEAETQQALGSDAAYRSQLDAARAAESRAKRARLKTERATADRSEKGAPYEGDPLFMYLWRRRFATPEYIASGLVRSLDGWVARLCDFHNARPNYALLIGLPEELGRHAEKIESEAQQLLEAVQALEESAARDAGIDEARSRQEAADEALAELDDGIEAIDAELREIERMQAEFLAHQDPSAAEANHAIAASLREERLSALMREARETPTDVDDEIVEQLAAAQERHAELRREVRQERELLANLNARVTELERIGQEFRRRRYDSGNSGFAKGALIGAMLNQFMNGLLNSRDLWSSIERQQRWERRRSDPSFGSGRIRGGGRIWSAGRPRGRGGFGGGGFGTGGGFGGGGGFKTGGGF